MAASTLCSQTSLSSGSINVNRRRGEVYAEIDGNAYCLCLTLGSLAQLEARLQIDNLSTLCERLAAGRFSADDLIAILAAGLRGGGHVISDEEVGEMHIDGGFSGFANLVGELLSATFGDSSAQSEKTPSLEKEEPGEPNPY